MKRGVIPKFIAFLEGHLDKWDIVPNGPQTTVTLKPELVLPPDENIEPARPQHVK